MSAPKNMLVFEEGDGSAGTVMFKFDRDQQNLADTMAKTIANAQMCVSEMREFLATITKEGGEKV